MASQWDMLSRLYFVYQSKQSSFGGKCRGVPGAIAVEGVLKALTSAN